MPETDHEELLGEDVTDPKRKSGDIIILIVAVALLALTLFFGYSHP
jgi:hypothetical protein